MKLDGEFIFEGPREKVWELLLDPEVLAKVLPGVQELEKTGEDTYRGRMQAKVGPVGGVFNSQVKILEKSPPDSYRMEVEAKAGPGFVKGKAAVRLEEKSPDQTLMKYQAEINVGGLLASVGQRLLDSVGRSLIRQSLEALNSELQKRLK